MTCLNYDRFVQAKAAYDDHQGFTVDVDAVHPILKPHQVDLVRWAVAGGRRAIFGAFGIGKTAVELETPANRCTGPTGPAPTPDVDDRSEVAR